MKMIASFNCWRIFAVDSPVQIHRCCKRFSSSLILPNFSTSSHQQLKSPLNKIFGNHNVRSLFIQTTHLPYISYITQQQVRFYAKSKDKPKAGGKKNVIINENEMSEVMDVELFKSMLEELLSHMKDEFLKQLSIRGTAGALETLEIEFDGATYPLQELAQVGRKNPQLIVLNLSALPDACQPIMKAIQDSGMNLNPQQEGTTIYVPLPKVTREHREFLAKNAKVIFVKYKTNFQSVQNKFIKHVKGQKDVSEDVVFNVIQQVMKMTEQYIAEAEKLVTLKQKELLDTK